MVETPGAVENGGDEPTRDPHVSTLMASARRWMRLSLTGWADEDHEAVSMLAPIALEHLGKATLWSRNPALLVPLAANAEESLRILTDVPDLSNPKLRTVGLAVVLQRLERCLPSFPLTKDRVNNLVDTRNGAVHAGARARSKEILRDALSLSQVMLSELDADPKTHYGDQFSNVQGLLDEKRSEVEARVSARMARARNHLAILEEKLGQPLFDDTMATLEADARFAIEPDSFSSFGDTIAIDQECPECASNGRLIGRLDAAAEVDWDVEKIGDTYETYPMGEYWDLTYSPQAFECNVCKLALNGYDELSAGRLPSTSFALEPSQLDDDFDIDSFARSIHDEWD